MELLTEDEKTAINLAGELANLCHRIVVKGGHTREQDLTELITPIHLIQRTIMSNAAARAYPGEFRRLGTSLDNPFCRSAACPDYTPGDAHQTFSGKCMGGGPGY